MYYIDVDDYRLLYGTQGSGDDYGELFAIIKKNYADLFNNNCNLVYDVLMTASSYITSTMFGKFVVDELNVPESYNYYFDVYNEIIKQ